jgi:hypothetical protein
MGTNLLPAMLGLFVSVALAAAQPTPQPLETTGVEGTITVSPVQGGPTRQGAAEAKPLPGTAFIIQQGDRVVASFVTDEQGRFRVSLGPGHYTISKKERGGLGSFGPFEVDVRQGQMKSVAWACDLGIR